MMQIYFARSIRGGHNEGDATTYFAIIKAIKDAGHLPALEAPASPANFIDRNEYIYQRDIEWLDTSQAMIAEVSNPSLGVGYEIAYAELIRGIPILTLAVKDTNVSAMIAGNFDVVYYRDSQDLAAQCREFLNQLVKAG